MIVLSGGAALGSAQVGMLETLAGAGIRPALLLGTSAGAINACFFADLFLMLANQTDTRMTATEVAERHEEKLLMLGPVLERLSQLRPLQG